jgi:hypothetical protein
MCQAAQAYVCSSCTAAFMSAFVIFKRSRQSMAIGCLGVLTAI